MTPLRECCRRSMEGYTACEPCRSLLASDLFNSDRRPADFPGPNRNNPDLDPSAWMDRLEVGR